MSADKRRGRPKGSGIDDNSQLQRVAAMLAADPNMKPTTAIRKIGVNDPSVIRRLRDKFHLARPQLMTDLGRGSDDAMMAPREMATANRSPPLAQPTKATTAATEAPRVAQARIAQPVRKADAKPVRGAEPVASEATAVATATVAAVAVETNDAPSKIAAPAARAAATVAVPATPTATAPVAVAKTAAEVVAPKQPAAAPKAATTPAPKAATAPAALSKPAMPPQMAPKAAAGQADAPSQPVMQTSVDPTTWMITMCGFGLRAATTALEAQVAFATQLVRLPQVAIALRQHVMLNELALTFVAPRSAGRNLN